MRKIIFVSRLDSDCSLGAHMLCEIATDLLKKYPDIKILIIGGGTEYKKISKQAKEINKISKKDIIITTGAVPNPSKYFDAASLFIGVSRAALEGMANGLPVILLGNEGYLGLLDKKNLNYAQKSNFTCRNSNKMCDNNTLFSEICYFFELDKHKKQELSFFSYEIVKSHYASSIMAQKTLDFYTNVLTQYKKTKHPLKIAICGYYGHGNLGDEAILSVIRQKIIKTFPDSKIGVLKSSSPLKNLLILNNADIFIFGGGSLLQNSTSNISFLYYVATIKAAHLLCKKTFMVANGIGPIKKRLFSDVFIIKILKKAINSFDFISVRDKTTQKMLKNLLPSRKIHFFPDPALITAKELQMDMTSKAEKSCFVYIPSHKALQANSSSIECTAKHLAKTAEYFNIKPIICVLHPKDDARISEKLKTLMTNAKIVYPRSEKELIKIISKSEFVISHRYHGTLFACVCNTPALSVSADPKLHGLSKDLALFPVQRLTVINNPDDLISKICLLLKYHAQNNKTTAKKIIKNATLSDTMLQNILEKF